MNNILSFTKGITRTPSDLLCEDGDLAECINLEVKDQELVPMELPVSLPFSLEPNEKLVYVHNIQSLSLKNYIVYNTETKTIEAFYFDTIRKGYGLSYVCSNLNTIVSLGNTLIAYTDDGPVYFLFGDGAYTYLGNRLPKPDISFNLSGNYKIDDSSYKITTSSRSPDHPDITVDPTNVHLSHINRFVKENTSETFMYPFFVRFALLMYNGEYICHSAPVLLLPSSFASPQLIQYKTEFSDGNALTTGYYVIGAYVAELQYRINNLSNLGRWKDIIKGVGIFVTKQSYLYDQSVEEGEKENVIFPSMKENFFIGKLSLMDQLPKDTDGRPSRPDPDIRIDSAYSKQTTTSLIKEHLTVETISSAPTFERETFKSNLLTSMSSFYLYTTLAIDDLETAGSTYNTLSSTGVNDSENTIEQQERLESDYMSNDILIPKFATVYNGRLNIANIKRKLFEGFSAPSLVQPLDGNMTYTSYVTVSSSKTITVKKESSQRCSLNGVGFFLYYPDTDAKEITICNDMNQSCSVPLAEHPYMNGAYALLDFNEGLSFIGGSNIYETEDTTEEMPNKLFTSDVNNPFRFPLAGINTIGTGEILGMTALTRPISPGQYGTFPLMAFCTDGNFAMKVDEEGFYSGISPLQEDIILGNDKITPLENSILVITQKGIMHTTQGNDMVKIAGQLDGKVFDISKLKDIEQTVQDTISFHDFLKDARMAYSYSTNRVFIYNPSKNYVYVYSFNNGTVSKLCINEEIINHVIDYPNVIIETKTGKLYNLYEREDRNVIELKRKGFALTRPLKFGGPLTLKTFKHIRSIVTRLTKTSSVKYRIYASNDNEHYVLCSRYGRPYKYYRIAMYTDLLPKEAFSGVVLVTEERRTNKLR